MIKLLEAINRGILKALNELTIESLSDLVDSDLDLLDSILAKNINNKISMYKYFPKTKEELAEIIESEVKKKGWNCNLNHIDTSQITDMSYLFGGDSDDYNLGEFNGDISRWDVSNVTDMSGMFDCSLFNGDISNWNVSNVENMCSMFSFAESFNQPIGDWDVSNVKNIAGMFWKASSFNLPLNKWNVSNVENMSGMFYKAKSFNLPIEDWDVSKVTNMQCMFCYSEFNQDLSNWKLKSDCETYEMFYKCPIKKGYKPKGIKE